MVLNREFLDPLPNIRRNPARRADLNESKNKICSAVRKIKKMTDLWTPKVEKAFFKKATNNFASPDQLFYVTDDGRYLAYWPKDYKGSTSTLQSRNALIGNFTETWTRDLLENCVKAQNLYVVQGARCKELGLTSQSEGDVVISKKKTKQLDSGDILVIFEVKMSVVWNWELNGDELVRLGDYKTHKGQPGLLRSDSMLKATGKAINIRVSSHRAASIPIIVLGNTPITNSYREKVDHLRTSGIVQGFWSINPNPLDEDDTIKSTSRNGFLRFDTYESFRQSIVKLVSMKTHFFSSMKSKDELGRYIEIANKRPNYEQKAEAFLKLLGFEADE